MKLNQGKQLAVLATVAGTAAVFVSTGLAGAAPTAAGNHSNAALHATTHKKTPPPPKPGLYITGEPKVTTATRSSAYVVDSGNREHFVTIAPSVTQPKMDAIYYYTRALGAKTWTVHAAPTLINRAGSPRLEEEQYPYAGEIEVVVYACDGTYAAAASATANRLPEFTLVQKTDTCTSTASAVTSYRHFSTGFVDARFGRYTVGVLEPDAETTGTWDLVAGYPGGSFTTLLSLPTADSFVPTQIAASPDYYKDLVVVGYGIDGSGDKGVFATSLTWTYDSTTQTETPGWTDLREIATLGNANTDYTIQSLTDFEGTTDVGLYKAPGTSVGQTHTLFIDERDPNDQWSSPIGLEHSNLNDRDLLLVRNPRSGTLHATWERVNSTSKTTRRTKSGILQQRLNKDWTKALFLTHWYKDRPLEAGLDTHGNIHVDYQQS